MGRNRRNGLTFFPFDVDFFQDIKIRKLIKYQGSDAVTVYTLLLCLIYKNGYYMRWDEELPFIVSEQTGLKEAHIQEVFISCMKLGLFSKELFESEKVITSSGIQERYRKICIDSRRVCDMSEYNLISSEEMPISSVKTCISSEEMPINSVKSTQRKEKKSKVNNNPPLTPPRENEDEGKSFVLEKILADGKKRNTEGLAEALDRLRVPKNQQDEIMYLSNFGLIGGPVWPIVHQCISSLSKSMHDPSRIKLPGNYIIKKLKELQNESSSSQVSGQDQGHVSCGFYPLLD